MREAPIKDMVIDFLKVITVKFKVQYWKEVCRPSAVCMLIYKIAICRSAGLFLHFMVILNGSIFLVTPGMQAHDGPAVFKRMF